MNNLETKNKFILRFKEPNYIIKEKQGVVICNLEAEITTKDYRNFCYLIPDEGIKVKGVARLCKGDTFNETIGKRIAVDKAKVLCYKKACSTLKEMIKEWKFETKVFQNTLDTLTNYKEIIETNLSKETYLNGVINK